MAAIQGSQMFTAVSTGSVAIATSAVIVVTNTLYTLFNLSRKWTAFSASLLVAYLNVVINPDALWYDWILAFINACLLFCSALGLNELVAVKQKSGQRAGLPAKCFFSSWLS